MFGNFNRELHPLGYMHRLDRSLSIMTLVRAGSLCRLCMCWSVESVAGWPGLAAHLDPGPLAYEPRIPAPGMMSCRPGPGLDCLSGHNGFNM